jgi:glycosyltransferase involved in cell wall biosynthesis
LDTRPDLWIEQHAPLFDEVIVLDTGSTDGTIELIESIEDKYENLTFIKSYIKDDGTNAWFRKCKRLAVDYAKYNHIIFLDVDEYLHEKFRDRVYNFENRWKRGERVNGSISYVHLIGNLFNQMQGWSFPWQVRIFRKDHKYTVSKDGGNFDNIAYRKTARPLMFVYHFTRVKDKKKQMKNNLAQTSRHNNPDKSVEYNNKSYKYYKDFDPNGIIEEVNIAKRIGGFPKVVAENPKKFYKYAIDEKDEKLLKFYMEEMQ